MITPKRAKAIVNAGYEKVKIRTMLTCKSHNGACSKCYGANLATGQAVQVGEAVGIIAAQSIGEPGTQPVSYTHLLAKKMEKIKNKRKKLVDIA